MALHRQIIEFEGENFEHLFLCHYQPLSAGSDNLSKSIICFKKNQFLHVEAWVECSISELEKASIGKKCLVLRVLDSDQIKIERQSTRPLDMLCRRIAVRFHLLYLPELLQKTRVTSKMKFLSRQERIDELEGCYVFAKPTSGFGDIKEILIVDDILTTGATVKAIIRSIRMIMPGCSITLFTLASTDRIALLNMNPQLASVSYEWNSDHGWNIVAKDSAFYSELSKLKSQIILDSW